MKKVIFLILLIIPLWLLQSAFISNDIVFPEKKIQRTINKILKLQSFEIEKIEEFQQAENGKFHSIENNGQTQAYLYIGRVNSCRSGGCELNTETLQASFEFFDYFMILDTKAKIKKVKIFNYQATYGHEVMSNGWLRQFIGYDGKSDLKYGKQIETISGATISARSLNNDVQYVTKILKVHLQEGN